MKLVTLMHLKKEIPDSRFRYTLTTYDLGRDIGESKPSEKTLAVNHESIEQLIDDLSSSKLIAATTFLDSRRPFYIVKELASRHVSGGGLFATSPKQPAFYATFYLPEDKVQDVSSKYFNINKDTKLLTLTHFKEGKAPNAKAPYTFTTYDFGPSVIDHMLIGQLTYDLSKSDRLIAAVTIEYYRKPINLVQKLAPGYGPLAISERFDHTQATAYLTQDKVQTVLLEYFKIKKNT